MQQNAKKQPENGEDDEETQLKAEENGEYT